MLPGQDSPALAFLFRASEQARDRAQQFRRRLVLRRRTQTRTALAIAVVSAFLVHVTATPPAPSCDTAVTTTSVAIPPDWRVVAMPGGLAVPAITPGDSVDVVADGTVVAAGALVVATPTGESGALVAVPTAAAAVVATAAQSGSVALVVVPR